MRILLFNFFLLVLLSSATAQLSEPVQFDVRTFDFGSVREDQGPFEHSFTFTNNTADSIRISDVKASCGCTVPSWSNDVIAPGSTGFVQARYNADRIGTFSKNLQVNFDGAVPPVTLYLQGNVLPAPRSPEEELPTLLGNLHMKYRSVNLGKVLTTDEPAEKTFDLYNGSDVPMHIDSLWQPNHISASFEPDTLAAKSSGQLKIVYHAKQLGDLGFQSENITLFTNDTEEPVKQISVYTTIAEYFPPMTDEELKKAAHLKINGPVFDFDRIERDSVYSTKFTITNTGQSDLQVRQVEGNCACINASIDKTTIKSGKEATITVSFDTKGRLGNQQKSVTVYTNDPISPAQRITIKAYVKQEND
jgi:hypothetical protein